MSTKVLTTKIITSPSPSLPPLPSSPSLPSLPSPPLPPSPPSPPLPSLPPLLSLPPPSLPSLPSLPPSLSERYRILRSDLPSGDPIDLQGGDTLHYQSIRSQRTEIFNVLLYGGHIVYSALFPYVYVCILVQ